jgi:hypothetical protein
VKPRDLLDLLCLAALWGASFLFMRLGAHAFGPVALVFLRVAGARVLLGTGLSTGLQRAKAARSGMPGGVT